MPESKPAAQPPLSSGSIPIGLLAPMPTQTQSDELPRLSAVAAKILDDPIKVRQLMERVYQLMQHDLQLQHERQGHYGGRF